MLISLYHNAREVPARSSRQSGALETAGDIPDVARIDSRGLYANNGFSLTRLRDRDFFEPQDGRRSKFSEAKSFHHLSAHGFPIRATRQVWSGQSAIRA